MIPSRDIADYVEVLLAGIPTDREITFRIYVYLKNNNHIVCLRSPGALLSEDAQAGYRKNGLTHVFIHKDEHAAYLEFLKPRVSAKAPEPVATEDIAPPQKDAEEPLPRLQEGELLKRVLESPVFTPGEKKAVAATLAQTMLERIASAPTPQHQAQEVRRARRLISSIIDRLASEVHEDLKKIWDVAALDKDLQHGVNVATFGTLFALAFGRIDPALLSEIALAGLLHDLGMGQMRSQVAARSQHELSESDLAELKGHVQSSIELIKTHLPTAPERVTEIVHQHQELFDGSGYPRGLEGFDFDDIAQLVAMADLTETVRVGQWDGYERSFKEAFGLIESLEQTKTFPHFFNPEVFRQVSAWTTREGASDSLEEAASRVAEVTRTTLGLGKNRAKT